MEGCHKRLYAYGGRELQVTGHAKVEISAADKRIGLHLVVTKSGSCLLGHETSQALGLLRISSGVSSEFLECNVVGENLAPVPQAKYPTVFVGVGKLKDYKLHVDSKVIPVAQKPRRVPFAGDQLLEKLTDFELKRKLVEHRNITLEEALDKVRAWEVAGRQATNMTVNPVAQSGNYATGGKADQRRRDSDRRQSYNANFVGDQNASESEENCAFAFAVTENQGETCNATRLKEPVLEVTPVAQKPRRVPFAWREKVTAKVEDLIAKDRVEPVNGPTSWVSPVVIAPKASADIRLCVDMRKANAAIIRERIPIPTVDEVLENLNGSALFSKLNLCLGFHQTELDEDSRDITTFATHDGLFRYKRLSFGVNSAPEKYQQIIRQVVSDIGGVQNIADDLIVHGKNNEEHDRHLHKVLQRLEEKNLTLNPQKCQ
ncbi:Retrovirus-related Pol polyprotein [Stylophora pistillata]|uniref:Retrovirus-related Pol polyprotein n=1 Tax=Stylophora pistillata TaxID=50429 RepID=A0A2B4REV0_STYPI|nr:Retrovirus-related Pol polyprotein [Stylophora pistillata]